MALGQTQFDINVNFQGGQRKGPTQSKSKQTDKIPTTFSGFFKDISVKNHAMAGMVAGSALGLGKTYINLQFSVSEQTNKAKNFNFGLKLAGYGMTIMGATSHFGAAGAVGSVVIVGAQITGDVLSYNASLKKRDIRYNYNNEKYKINVANGSRYRGGSL
jgi:hypothetical protein